MDRRAFLASSAAIALAPGCSHQPAERALRVAPARQALVGAGNPETAVWTYNGAVPDPTMRANPGDKVQVVLHNELPESTAIHVHGLRLPNAMDGVPDITQRKFAPRPLALVPFFAPPASFGFPTFTVKR